MISGNNIKKIIKLNNTYEIPGTGIKEILDKVDRFVTNMETFRKEHSNYDYKIALKNNNDLWSAKIKITNGKQEGNGIPDSAI
jgi:hypothetical protein